jgi:hypothetical protein
MGQRRSRHSYGVNIDAFLPSNDFHHDRNGIGHNRVARAATSLQMRDPLILTFLPTDTAVDLIERVGRMR